MGLFCCDLPVYMVGLTSELTSKLHSNMVLAAQTTDVGAFSSQSQMDGYEHFSS